MEKFMSESLVAGVVLSLASYEIGIWLKKRTGLSIFNPLLVAIILVIVFLKLFGVDYESYNSSAKYLSYLLTPATVSLAIPLYLKMDLLKKYPAAILTAILSGVLSSLCIILLFSALFHLGRAEYVTLLPKSITTAIGMGISEELGGYVPITTAVIIITGVLGNMFGEMICKIANIRNPIAKGLAIGTASHAIGTAKAMEMGEVEGAMSSLAIVVSGICTVAGAAIFAGFY